MRKRKERERQRMRERERESLAKLFLLNAITCQLVIYEIYGTYNLCITSEQYSKNIQNVQK